MDLSAVIFVVLALAWAGYLIPKALKHHDEVAAERLEESHSDRARVLSRRRTTVTGGEVEVVDETVTSIELPIADDADGTAGSPAPERRSSRGGRLRRTSRPAPALSTAGRAARNRRRVLAGLLAVLGATWALTWFAYLPAITPLWPTLAVAAWLVLARVSVVKMQRARRAAPARSSATSPQPAVVRTQPASAPVAAPVVEHRETSTPAFDQRPEVVTEREALKEAMDEALADDGSLWDPLPLTLPTYVGKATARRTVRTIELTGVTSSGHDESDSALAREAGSTEVDRSEQTDVRRVAGA